MVSWFTVVYGLVVYVCNFAFKRCVAFTEIDSDYFLLI
jgi:hypothetical protein